MIHITRGGVIAAPSRDPACVTPCANPRSLGRIQRERDRVDIGNAPASPAPKMKRIASSDVAFQPAAVSEVKTLHQLTMIVNARRGPILSPSHPPGTWNSA